MEGFMKTYFGQPGDGSYFDAAFNALLEKRVDARVRNQNLEVETLKKKLAKLEQSLLESQNKVNDLIKDAHLGERFRKRIKVGNRYLREDGKTVVVEAVNEGQFYRPVRVRLEKKKGKRKAPYQTINYERLLDWQLLSSEEDDE